MEKKQLRFFFDKIGDVLDVSIGKPKKAISREIGDDILVRVDPDTDEVIGFTILNFEKRFEHGKPELIPISVDFLQVTEA